MNMSRIEQALRNCIDGSGADNLPAPLSASERLLHQIAEKVRGGPVWDHTSFKETIERTVTSVTFPTNLTTIGTFAFNSCTNLALTSLPDSVTTIGNYAFQNCTNLALTSLPDSVTTIGAYAFFKCTNLALTSLPDGITSIEAQTFRMCENLKNITIPARVTTIDAYAFANCSGLTEVRFEGTPSSILQTSFRLCNNLISIKVPWAEGAVANAPWGATNATITYNYTGSDDTEDTPGEEVATFSVPTFDGSHAVFGDENRGYIECYSSGTLTFASSGTVDIFAVAGGSGADPGTTSANVSAETFTATGGQGGRAGAYNTWTAQEMEPGEYSVIIGSANGASSFDSYTASGYSGTGGAQAIVTRNVSSSTVKSTNGYAGSAGVHPFSDSLFTRVAGAGGSGAASAGVAKVTGGVGGAGGGGNGGSVTSTLNPPSLSAGEAGTANTGAGGGGGAAVRIGLPSTSGYKSAGGAGGSGIVIIRWGDWSTAA